MGMPKTKASFWPARINPQDLSALRAYIFEFLRETEISRKPSRLLQATFAIATGDTHDGTPASHCPPNVNVGWRWKEKWRKEI
jgi:hypothetical protein